MGSRSDYETMRHCCETLESLQIPFETRVVSAHRTPDLLFDYAKSARSRGLQILIAGAGGAAHLPGMCAAQTSLPVLGVPVQSKALNGFGFAFVNRSDARRSSGCNARHWPRRSRQRRTAGGLDSVASKPRNRA